MKTKEQVHDAEIAPLMAQIIAIAKRENISFCATFDLDDDIACSTVTADESGYPSEYIKNMARQLMRLQRRPSGPVVAKVTAKDGSETRHAFLD